MITPENIIELKNRLLTMDKQIVEEVKWVVGEAMHYAYMCGAIDTRKHQHTLYPELKQRVLDYLHDDAEREVLSILSD